MDPALLALEGAPASKQFRKVPMTTQTFFSGLVTQRSPFNSLDNRVNRRYLGGRPDQLADGLNVELTNSGTYIRRPGTSFFFSGSVPENSINTFYSFHQLTGNILTMMDGQSRIWTVSPAGANSIFTKSSGAGQSYFQGVGNTLYIGDGVDQVAWNPSISSTVRNWGISIGSVNNAAGPNAAGTGSDVSVPGGVGWANPGNIAAQDGNFATVTLASTSGGGLTAGPLNAGTGSQSGAGVAWGTPSGIAGGGSTTVGLNVGQNSKTLSATNFGFSIPATATILGISMKFTRGNASGTIFDNIVKLLKAGVGVGTDHSSGSAWAGTATTYGSSSDLWGTSWTPSDINNTGFGVEFSCGSTDPSNFESATASSLTITITYSVPASSNTFSDYLEGTNFGFSISSGTTIQGILVEVKGFQSQIAGTTLQATILKNSNLIGTTKSSQLPASNGFISFGGNGDLWGTTWTYNDINQTGFGIALQAINPSNSSASWSVDFVRITVYGIGGPNVSLVSGSLTATVGYQYVFAYGNSNSGHVSNPSPASNLVKPTAQGVQISLTASTDPQVNQIRVFRTKDGGSVYFELPTSPYPNTTQNVTDNAPDSTLQQLIFWPSVPTLSNTPPPAGLGKLTYHLGRVWGAVGNFVYYSAGPDIILGNGNEAFPPANFFLFPSTVNRLVPYSSGLLVFTSDDVYIILGTSLATFYAMPFQQGVGLLSYNALDIQGTNIFLLASDRQFLSLSSSGINEIGYAIGDLLQANFDPAQVHVASVIAGTSEKAVYVSDGSQTWFRCNWNQPPEGGPAWSPKAVIGGGCNALTQVETSPGVHQLLMAFSTGGNSFVLFRDVNVFTDAATNGPYSDSFLTLGSLVLAQPGQIAEIDSIVLELRNLGSVPSLSILTDEISGTFESLPNFVNDPPTLVPSTTVMSNRWYLAQGANAARLRHMQIKIDYNQDTIKNELLTLSVFGGLIHEN